MKESLKIILFFTLVCSFVPISVYAKINLPALFGDHMILQQDMEVQFWGTAKENTQVTITTSWNNQRYRTQSDTNGAWSLTVITPKADKENCPYRVIISDGEQLELTDVLIGEVWLASGQSNMEMVMNGYHNQPVKGALDAIVSSANKNIRLFTVKKANNLRPMGNVQGEWKFAHPESISNFSATAYFYGRKLHEILGVPVGIINASWGGTRIESWMSNDALKQFKWLELPQKDSKEKIHPNIPGSLFNGMISPITGFGIRGVIWYQGESNRFEPEKYQDLLLGLIEDWRYLWQIGDFAFYYVQIAPYDYGLTVNSAFLREAQLKASSKLPNTGMACLMDIGEEKGIHPTDKQTGAKRLAYLALEHTYGINENIGDSPVLDSVSIEGPLIKLTFKNAPNGLTSFGQELANFEISGKNKRFFPAHADITANGITVYSARVPNPVAVRYAFKNFVIGDLFGTNGLPVSSFRTDNW